MSAVREYWKSVKEDWALAAEDAELIESFIADFERENRNYLEVPCDGGKLYASFFGDPGIYDGIAVDFIRDDGLSTQCCVVETETSGKPHVVANPGELHVLVWDGNHELAMSTQVVDKNGEYVY